MTLTEYVDQLRNAQAHPNKNDRYLVVKNTAPAYRRMGTWGIYDTERGAWINFRETEVEAYRLLSTLLQEPDRLPL